MTRIRTLSQAPRASNSKPTEGNDYYDDECDQLPDAKVLQHEMHMLGDVDPSTAVSIWLLVLFQLFRSPVIILNAEIRRWRLKKNAGVAAGEITTNRFFELVTELLYLTCDMGSDSFAECMKALVAINWQIPLRYSLESTEVGSQTSSLTMHECLRS